MTQVIDLCHSRLMKIDTHLSADALTATLSGRLDITTAAVLEQTLQLDGIRLLTLDLGDCSFVSSAGLREVLKAQKKVSSQGGKAVLINVSPEVHQVFEVTGFSRLIEIRRKAREISLEGLEFLSAGVCGECYRLDRESIVKLYNEGIGADIAEKEKAFAMAAFVAGIPTAISYDVVSCGTRTGVVYEMLDAKLFSVVIRENLQAIDDHGRMLAQVASALHASVADPQVFPDFKASMAGYIANLSQYLPSEDVALLQSRLAAMPEGDRCVHFDLHTSNIMLRGNEPVIIDMGDLSRGSPMFDLGLLYMIFGLPEMGICEMATRIPNAQGEQLWKAFEKHYFADLPAEEHAFFNQNRHFLAAMRLIYTISFLPKLREASLQWLRDLLLPKIRAEGSRGVAESR